MNGETGILSGEPGAPLRTLLEELQEWAGGEKLVVAGIELDGETLSRERLEANADRDIGEFESMDVTVQPLHEVVLDTTREMKDHVDTLNDVLQQAITSLHEGNDEEGLKRTADIILLWQTLSQGVLLVQKVMPGLGEKMPEMEESLESLSGHLGELNESIKIQDPVGIADILEYELVPHVETWRSFFDLVLSEGAAGESAGDEAE